MGFTLSQGVFKTYAKGFAQCFTKGSAKRFARTSAVTYKETYPETRTETYKKSPARTRVIFCSLLLASMSLLQACGSGYQAPILEQGERQDIRPPIIVDSSTPDSSLRAPDGRARVSSSSPVASSSRSSGNTSSVRNSGSTSAGRSNSTAGTSTPGTHRVRSGDTLFSIAFQYDLDFRSLALANGLRPPYTIFVDQQLSLDINNVSQSAGSVANSNLGTAVGNDSVARAQGSVARTGGVLRQPISSTARELQWQWPHRGRVIRAFGTASNKGLDIGGSSGEAVLAAGDGDVVYSGRGIQGTGDLIIIRHSDRYLSAYAHNSVMLVSEGSHVSAGDKIAEIGRNASGVEMLHFEIRQDGNSVDPIRFLPRR